jgi:hypothetical protein
MNLFQMYVDLLNTLLTPTYGFHLELNRALFELHEPRYYYFILESLLWQLLLICQ